MSIQDLLRLTVAQKASDLHLAAGRPPVLRIDGVLFDIDAPPLGVDDIRGLASEILNEDQADRLEKERDLDCSYSLPGLSRFRVNIHFQRGSLAVAIRVITDEISG